MTLTSLYVESNGTVSAEYTEGRVPMGKAPTPAHVWDAGTRTWVYSTAVAAAQARAKRDALMAECDWTQIPDVPLTTQAAWKPYRQALRDITTQAGFPATINWPTPPA